MIHRITRLLPETEYSLKIAAVSESGQGSWSNLQTFMTTPAPPMSPTGVSMMQVSNSTMQLEWRAGESPHPLIYEAQFRAANLNQEYTQVSDCVTVQIYMFVCWVKEVRRNITRFFCQVIGYMLHPLIYMKAIPLFHSVSWVEGCVRGWEHWNIVNFIFWTVLQRTRLQFGHHPPCLPG